MTVYVKNLSEISAKIFDLKILKYLQIISCGMLFQITFFKKPIDLFLLAQNLT